MVFKTKLLRYPSDIESLSGSSAACLGNFDGVHIGHQSLLKKAVAACKSGYSQKSLLVSFYPHPAVVLGKAQEIPSITQLSGMIGILSQIGIDYLYMFHFTKSFSEITADRFVNDFLFEKLKVNSIFIGQDARIGASAEGDAEFILNTFHNSGKRAEIVDYVNSEGRKVSSRAIRECIHKGDIETANEMLGRCFLIIGRVIKGRQLGKSIGFPTANLHIKHNSLIPALGVYASSLTLNGKKYKSVTNVGVRPTVDNGPVSIESYIINYLGDDFYNSQIEIEFETRIRDEMKFADLKDLKKQIEKDIKKAEQLNVCLK